MVAEPVFLAVTTPSLSTEATELLLEEKRSVPMVPSGWMAGTSRSFSFAPRVVRSADREMAVGAGTTVTWHTPVLPL